MGEPIRSQIPIIAITGSAGKTTTKEMLASILKIKWKIFKSVRNLNIYKYTRKYLELIPPGARAIVLEYGLEHPGDIRKHCEAIKPNIGIITNVGTAHLGNFGGDIRRLALAKSELIRYMDQSGILFLNADDENSKFLDTDSFLGEIFTVGIKNNADIRADHVTYTKNGMSFQAFLDNKNYTFLIPAFGLHNVYNALFAIAAASRLGISPNVIQRGLRTYLKPSRRLTIYRLAKNIKIIDDSFSANPNAVMAALDVLHHMGNRRRIAVLGSMLQLGEYSTKGHVKVGKYLASKRIDYLYTYGKEAQKIGEAAIKHNFPAKNTKHFRSREDLQQYLVKQLKPETTILIKGSNYLKLNKTVEFLLERARRTKK